MNTDPILEPFAQLDPSAIDALAAVLGQHNFQESAILTASGPEVASTAATDQQRHEDLSVDIETEYAASPLTALMRLFLLSEAVPLEAVEAVFGAPLAAQLEAGGLLAVSSGQVRSKVSIMPYQGIYLVCDHIRSKWLDVGRHAVMSVGNSSIGLANGTPRRPVGRALDMGCGSGFQALLLARHAEQVVAVDINPRALAMGRFAARLCGISNIDFRMTNFFSAVEGETFDLIVSNPPFVVSPESRFQYRDGGLGGDKVTEIVLSQAGGFLNEGGMSLTVCEWARYRDTDPIARLSSWMAGNGCDVLVQAGKPAEMPAYSRNWLNPFRKENGEEAYRALYREWLAYYEKVGIEAVQMGFVAMRKRTGPPANWFRIDDSPEAMAPNWWEGLLVCIDQQHLLATSTDDELLARPFRLAPGTTFTQTLVQNGNRWSFSEGTLALTGSIIYHGTVDQWIGGLVARCDGQTALRPLIEEMASMLPVPKEVVVEKAMPIIRGLVARGFLLAGA